jgi:hypothetical protein
MGAMGPMGFISDERVKEDIRPVGETHDGQTIYSFRYKGDPRTQIGLLAQEVEQQHPDAVHTLPGGLKTVDYAKATGGFFGMPSNPTNPYNIATPSDQLKGSPQ